jgi:hypothetical protein
MSLGRRTVVDMKTIQDTLGRLRAACNPAPPGDAAVIGTVILATLALGILGL